MTADRINRVTVVDQREDNRSSSELKKEVDPIKVSTPTPGLQSAPIALKVHQQHVQHVRNRNIQSALSVIKETSHPSEARSWRHLCSSLRDLHTGLQLPIPP